MLGKESKMSTPKTTFTTPAVGWGHDHENTAVFGTRYKVPEFSSDATIRAICHLQGANNEFSEIAKIEGVTKVSSFFDNGYDVAVRKGNAFTWDELAPKITTLLEQRHDRIAAKTQVELLSE